MHIPGETFPPDWRGRPPGMPAEDVPVWHRFLDAHGAEFTSFTYNVRVGTPPPAPAEAGAIGKQLAAALFLKRIDAIGARGADRWVIEVASNAGLRAIGQLLVYCNLLRAEHPDWPACLPILVYDHADPDVLATAPTVGIRLVHA